MAVETRAKGKDVVLGATDAQSEQNNVNPVIPIGDVARIDKDISGIHSTLDYMVQEMKKSEDRVMQELSKLGGATQCIAGSSNNLGNQNNNNCEPYRGGYQGNHGHNQEYDTVTRMAKLDFPRFDGSNVKEWVWRVEQFFEMDRTPEFHKIRLLSIHLDGEAATWHQSFMLSEEGRRINRDWNLYKACVVYQFGTFEENCEFDGYEVDYGIEEEEESITSSQEIEEEAIQVKNEQILEEETEEKEEVIEKFNSVQDDDSNSMESLLISDSSKSQGTRLQIITEKEYAHHLFDEMTVKKQMLHEKEIRSFFSKCWKFKFKNLLCFPIDQVIQCGVLPHLVEFLKKEDFPKLLFEAITAPFAVILSGLGLNQAATNFYSFDQGRMAAYSLFEMITRSSSVANQGAVLASVQGNVEFRNVYFINADYVAVMEEGQFDEMGTHDELINLGGLYAELLKCEEETKFPRRCGALKPLSVQRDSEPSVIALLAVGIKQRMQQPKRKRNSLFPKNWNFKFKNRDLEREKQGWKQSDGAKCELNFQLEWLFFYGSLPRPPEHCKRKI